MILDPWRVYGSRHGMRRIVDRLYGMACLRCGWDEERTDMAHLVAGSHRLVDVVPLCPNCHRLLDFGRISKGEIKKLQRQAFLDKLGIDIEEEG